MEEILGYKVEKLPIKDLKKISDLISFEGPILSHFIDRNNRNYLFLWVDSDDRENRWLIWKISDEQLYNFIKGTCSLKDLLLEDNKENIYSADIDSNLNFNNIRVTDIADINENYIPEDQYYYEDEQDIVYKYLFEKFEKKLYLPHLKAIGFNCILKPRDEGHESTVLILEVSNFLKSIYNSFTSYIEFDFINSFRSDISDLTRLNRMIAGIKERLALRIVGLKYDSFNVTISADTIKTLENKKQNKWKREILNRYKSDVIDIDYHSATSLKDVANKFPESVIKKVHMPIIAMINNSNVEISINDHAKKFHKTYARKISKKNIDILLPPANEMIEEQPSTKKLMSVVIEVEKDNPEKITNKDIREGLLFSQEIKRFPIYISEVKGPQMKIYLDPPLLCEYYIENNITHLSNSDLGLDVEGTTASELTERFSKLFMELYESVLNSDDPNDIISVKLKGSIKNIVNN